MPALLAGTATVVIVVAVAVGLIAGRHDVSGPISTPGVVAGQVTTTPDTPSSDNSTTTPDTPSSDNSTTTPDTPSSDDSTTTPDTPPAVQQKLIDLLPGALIDRSSCETLPDSPLSAVAAVTCAPSNPGASANPPTRIIGIRFDNRSDMMNHFDTNADKGNTQPCGKTGWVLTTNRSVRIGQRTCYRNSDNVAVEAWTYDQQYLEIYAIGTDGNLEALHLWWARSTILLNCPGDFSDDLGCV